MEQVFKTAEEKMMEDKRRYYQKDKHNRKIREMNLELEQMINDKRDADAFLSVIASTFSGVYFVNLDADRVRHIFIPEYFEEMLEKSSHRFRQAILMYARSMVHPDFLRLFEEFCSYEILEEVLESGNVPEICYQRTDDTWMKLQVFKFKRYRQGKRETLWVFEASEPPTPAKETSAID